MSQEGLHRSKVCAHAVGRELQYSNKGRSCTMGATGISLMLRGNASLYRRPAHLQQANLNPVNNHYHQTRMAIVLGPVVFVSNPYCSANCAQETKQEDSFTPNALDVPAACTCPELRNERAKAGQPMDWSIELLDCEPVTTRTQVSKDVLCGRLGDEWLVVADPRSAQAECCATATGGREDGSSQTIDVTQQIEL
mmetsp:Transcript_10758/g.25756  ORF Transcript_10758/g.25756 Transcript_10758/m.25756 type:complete len:195 (+) Transcript_10758:418-1002(+)